MSELGITTTILATQLMDAVRKDEASEEGVFDLSIGLFGRHVSNWLRMVAKELIDRKAGGEAKIPDAVLSSRVQDVTQIVADSEIFPVLNKILEDAGVLEPLGTLLPCGYCGSKTSHIIRQIPLGANRWTCFCNFCEHPSSAGYGSTKHDSIEDYNHKQAKDVNIVAS